MGLLDTIKSMLGMGGAASAAAQAAQQAVAPGQPAQAAQAAQAAPPPSAPEDDSSDDDDDAGFKRDYDLEAKDDHASFDLQGDLEGWYVAEFRIEQAWEDDAGRTAIFAEYGIRDQPHYYQVKATVDRYVQSPAAQAKYGGMGEIMHVKMAATQKHMMAGMQAQMQTGALKGEVEPVEGVTLDQWAEAQARVAGGQNVDDIIKGIGCDRAKWDRVSAEWNARMSRDTTATIAMAYGNAFQKAQAKPGVSTSKYASLAANPGKGDLPMPLEQYIEIMEAQSAGATQGKDASAILKSFGLSVLDWSNLGGWFSTYFSENAMKNDGKLHKEWTALQEKYKAKYAQASADSDISF